VKNRRHKDTSAPNAESEKADVSSKNLRKRGSTEDLTLREEAQSHAIESKWRGKIHRRSESVFSLPIDLIEIDAKRFSYRTGGDSQTGLRSLLDVEVFNAAFGGIISVWFSPDRHFWLVDGHQRVALARRLGISNLNAQILDSGDTFQGATHHFFDEITCRAFGALVDLDKNEYAINLSKYADDLQQASNEVVNFQEKATVSLRRRLAYLINLSRLLLLRVDRGDLRWSNGQEIRGSRRNMLADIRSLLASEPDREFAASEIKSKLEVNHSNEKSFYSALAKLHNSKQIVRVDRARYKTGKKDPSTP
jgi:hypothetical protein